MISTGSFIGRALTDEAMELGEGPTYDSASGSLFWFDILGKTLCEFDVDGERLAKHALPFLGSVIAVVDAKRQLIASDQGLFLRDSASGTLSSYAAIEDKPQNRSNDGRVHPCGALWIGTMSRTAETGGGAIYHVSGTRVTKIFDAVSIPNGIMLLAGRVHWLFQRFQGQPHDAGGT